MMTSTKVSIGSAIAWFLLNIIASGSAPTGLGDPDFKEKVSTAASLQGLGNIFLIIAIIAIIITGYKK
ncbi:hypothetical protein G5S52_06275 [Grimontia sp. S25]|uniref:Uncharacterized protein n=1 Tax=Grimontia sedimenti TaxID=2711294 RepID=A0A6M1RI33_9GAMM|nr:hypothetical protein [Grimontia sedimenti]NGN97278.1 hypothetical protein [Grimontia sedimenti]